MESDQNAKPFESSKTRGILGRKLGEKMLKRKASDDIECLERETGNFFDAKNTVHENLKTEVKNRDKFTTKRIILSKNDEANLSYEENAFEVDCVMDEILGINVENIQSSAKSNNMKLSENRIDYENLCINDVTGIQIKQEPPDTDSESLEIQNIEFDLEVDIEGNFIKQESDSDIECENLNLENVHCSAKKNIERKYEKRESPDTYLTSEKVQSSIDNILEKTIKHEPSYLDPACEAVEVKNDQCAMEENILERTIKHQPSYSANSCDTLITENVQCALENNIVEGRTIRHEPPYSNPAFETEKLKNSQCAVKEDILERTIRHEPSYSVNSCDTLENVQHSVKDNISESTIKYEPSYFDPVCEAIKIENVQCAVEENILERTIPELLHSDPACENVKLENVQCAEEENILENIKHEPSSSDIACKNIEIENIQYAIERKPEEIYIKQELGDTYTESEKLNLENVQSGVEINPEKQKLLDSSSDCKILENESVQKVLENIPEILTETNSVSSCSYTDLSTLTPKQKENILNENSQNSTNHTDNSININVLRIQEEVVGNVSLAARKNTEESGENSNAQKEESSVVPQRITIDKKLFSQYAKEKLRNAELQLQLRSKELEKEKLLKIDPMGSKQNIISLKELIKRTSNKYDILRESIKKVFSDAQIEALITKKAVTWSPEDIAKAKGLEEISKPAFEYVQNVLRIPLPSRVSAKTYSKTESDVKVFNKFSKDQPHVKILRKKAGF